MSYIAIYIVRLSDTGKAWIGTADAIRAAREAAKADAPKKSKRQRRAMRTAPADEVRVLVSAFPEYNTSEALRRFGDGDSLTLTVTHEFEAWLTESTHAWEGEDASKLGVKGLGLVRHRVTHNQPAQWGMRDLPYYILCHKL